MSRETTHTLPLISGVGDLERNPSQEDQIRDNHRGSRLRYEMQRRILRVFGRTNYQRSLESQLDPNHELEQSQRRRAMMIPAEVLYDSRWSEPRHRVYQHRSEERILVTGENQQLDLNFINQTSYEVLRREGFQHIHLGLMMIRIQPLHARFAGTNVLVVLRDTRWADERSIIGSMEIDLSEGTQLVYIAPEMIISIHDFTNHLQLAL